MSAPSSDPGRTGAAIDAGLTGDKVPVSDPAAAPMNADAETAGTPTPAYAAEADLRLQERIARESGAAAVHPVTAGFDPAARRESRVSVPVIGVVLVASAVLIGILVGLA